MKINLFIAIVSFSIIIFEKVNSQNTAETIDILCKESITHPDANHQKMIPYSTQEIRDVIKYSLIIKDTLFVTLYDDYYLKIIDSTIKKQKSNFPFYGKKTFKTSLLEGAQDYFLYQYKTRNNSKIFTKGKNLSSSYFIFNDYLKINKQNEYFRKNNAMAAIPITFKDEYELSNISGNITTYYRDLSLYKGELDGSYYTTIGESYYYKDTTSLCELRFLLSSNEGERFTFFKINYTYKMKDATFYLDNTIKLNNIIINKDFNNVFPNTKNETGNMRQNGFFINNIIPYNDTTLLLFFKTDLGKIYNVKEYFDETNNKSYNLSSLFDETSNIKYIDYINFNKLFDPLINDNTDNYYSLDLKFFRKDFNNKYLFAITNWGVLNTKINKVSYMVTPDYMKSFTGHFSNDVLENSYKYYFVPFDNKNNILLNEKTQLFFGQNVSIIKSRTNGFYVMFCDKDVFIKYNDNFDFCFLNQTEDTTVFSETNAYNSPNTTTTFYNGSNGSIMPCLTDDDKYIYTGGFTTKKYIGYKYPTIKTYSITDGKFIKEKLLDFSIKGDEIVYMNISGKLIYILLYNPGTGAISFHKRNVDYLIK